MLIQLAKGLSYIHEENLVHCDLRPENALIWVERRNQSENEQENLKVMMKWSDFGLSKRTVKHESRFNWLAPEILTKTYENTAEIKLYRDGSAPGQLIRGTTKSDVFSEGLTFAYILLGGEHPYGTDNASVRNNLKKNNPVHLKSNSSTLQRDRRIFPTAV